MTSLATPRLSLAPLTPEDAAALFAIRADPRVARWQSFRPASTDEAAAFIARQPAAPLGTVAGWTQLGIRRDGVLVGDLGVCFHEPARRQAEVGVTVAPTHQGQGYATEALTALLGRLFHQVGVHRVFASVDPRNQASMALMARLGLRQEAWHRESLWFDGAWVDDVIFALLDREWTR